MTAINSYDAYGTAATGNTGRFGYTGQTWISELNLWHYKARFYSPRLGRFMQTDPIGYAAGMNLYAYVGNDPVNFVDPLGLDIVVLGQTCGSGFIMVGEGDGGGFTPRPRPPILEQELQNNQPCGQSPDGALNIVRGGLEWLSIGADGLSIAATATGVGAPIGGLVKGVQIGLEVGLAGINLYDSSQNGNFGPAVSQLAGRVAIALVPGARIGNRLRSSAAFNWGTHANGRLRSGFQHKIAAQNQAIDTVTGQATGSASQAAGCLVQ